MACRAAWHTPVTTHLGFRQKPLMFSPCRKVIRNLASTADVGGMAKPSGQASAAFSLVLKAGKKTFKRGCTLLSYDPHSTMGCADVLSPGAGRIAMVAQGMSVSFAART